MFNIFFIGLILFQNFNFVVLGDRTGSAKTETFEGIIDEIRVLSPDFLINVGDLIEGYTNDKNTIEAEWTYIIGQLNQIGCLYFLTPGNHDIWSPQSESIYIKHFGKTYYCFNYQGCHFVIIDNSRYDSISAMPPNQLSWLKQDLKRNKKALFTFCFLHKPFWRYPGQAETLHQIFKQGGVDYVFSGHDHYYVSKVWDSITYIQVGPSGSRLKEYINEEQGAFQNYLLVKVARDSINIAVIKPGSILPFDVVTTEKVAMIDRIENEAVKISKVNIKDSQTIQDTFGLWISNVTGRPVNTTLKWNFNKQVWQIVPESINCYLPVGADGYYKFQCRTSQPEVLFPLPNLGFSCPYQLKQTHRVKKILPIRRIANCNKVKKPPTIDGKLDDIAWELIKPLTIFGTDQGDSAPIEKTLVYFAYDENNFYIGAQCYESQITKLSANVTSHDQPVYKDDHLNFILQPNLDSVAYYQIFINPLGTIADRRCWLESGKNLKDPNWDLSAKIKTNRYQDNWQVEMAIPLAQFPNYSIDDWGFNIVRYQHRTDKVGIYQVPFAHDPKTFAQLKFSH